MTDTRATILGDCVCGCPYDDHRGANPARGTAGSCRRHPTHRYQDAVEHERIERVVGNVLLDHAPQVAAVVTAARALHAAMLDSTITWYRPPWGAISDVMVAVAALDGRPDPPSPPATGHAERLTQAELARYASTRCPTCTWIGPRLEHPDDCAGQPVPVELLIVPAGGDH
jgi:hypothetical protein